MPSTLTPEEQAVYDACMAKLKRSTTTSSRVTIEPDGDGFVVSAIARLSNAGLPPPKQAEVRERLILAIPGQSKLAALGELLEKLA